MLSKSSSRPKREAAMSIGPATLLLRHLRGVGGLDDFDGVPDRELLRRFVCERREPCFAALVHRHGPMVWRACTRVLDSRHDAEDVFQAVFLILARKAAAHHWRDSIASWLYTVAYRLACEVKTAAIRRHTHERL